MYILLCLHVYLFSDLYFLAIFFFLLHKKGQYISQHFLTKDKIHASKMSYPSQNRVKCMASKHLPLMETTVKDHQLK